MSKKAGYTIPDLTALAALVMDANNDTDCYLRVVADDGSGKPAFYLWRKATNTWMLLPISDNAIGDRTISSNISSLSDTGKLTTLLSSLATQIQAILGKMDWKSAPTDSLETLSTNIGTLASAISILSTSLSTKAPLNSPILITPNLGTPQSGICTNLTGLPLTTGITGVLGISNGGTGSSTQNFVSLSDYTNDKSSFDTRIKTTNYSRWSDFEKSPYQSGEWIQGQGTYYVANGTANHPGIISLNATSLNSWSSINTEKAYLALGNYTLYFIFQTPSLAPDGTDNWELSLGLCENPALSYLGSDAIALKARLSVSTGQLAWYFNNRKSSTTIETAIAGINCTVSTWYNVIISISNNSISITINGVTTIFSSQTFPTIALRLFLNTIKVSGSTTTATTFIDAVGITGNVNR